MLIKLKLQFCLLCKEPVVIYHLGGEVGGGGVRRFLRDHLIFRRTEWGKFIKENPKEETIEIKAAL